MNRWGQIPPPGDANSGDPRWRVHPLFHGLIVLTMFVGVFALVAERSPPATQPSGMDLRAEFRKISAPPGANADHDPEIHSKTGAVLVRNKYLIRSSTASVLAHYRTELTRNGWVYRQNFRGGVHWGEDYCKGKLLASVEFPGNETPNVSFSFAISWSGVSVRECP